MKITHENDALIIENKIEGKKMNHICSDKSTTTEHQQVLKGTKLKYLKK